MTKIIAPLALHDVISKHLLKNDTIITNTSLLPLHSFVDELLGFKTYDYNYDDKLKETLLTLKPQLKSLKGYVKHSSFINALKDFHIAMHLYNISCDSLNNHTTKDKDLKLIFDSLSKFVPQEIKNLNSLENILKDNPLQDTYIASFPLTSDYDKALVSLLKKYGLQEYSHEVLTPDHVSVYYANNMRSEVEASAQLIVEHNLTKAQVILLDPSYTDLVRQVYQRYNIPSNLDFDLVDNNVAIKFIAFCNLFVRQDRESFKAFISSNPLNLETINDLSVLNDYFNWDLQSFLDYTPHFIEDEIIHKSSRDTYNKHTEAALDSIEFLQELFKDINTDSTLTLIENVFNTLIDYQDAQSLNTFTFKLIQHQESLKESKHLKDDLERILLQDSKGSINSDYVVVVDTQTHEHFNKEHVLVLGSTLKNFPKLNTLSGVIDETYVKDLSYPDKTLRLREQIETLDSIKQGKNIYFFYPLSAYDGKAVEPSFSLLSYAKEFNAKSQRYLLVENDTYRKKIYQLRPDLAQQLFFKDNILKGSISSFEQYSNCPYAYFLQRGLKLYPKSMPELSYAYLGSVTHAIIETIIQKRIDSNENLNHDEVQQIIEINFKSLEVLKDPKVELVKQSLIEHFKLILDHLNEIDSDTHFKPILLEKEFHYSINDNIHLSGYIDRVDAYNDYIRVIDYKSSPHTLSASKLKKGLQLQLVTYLLAISLELDLKPAGAFYMLLRTVDTPVNPISIKKSAPYLIEHTQEDFNAEVLKKNRIEGWHFEEGEHFYTSSNYVASLSSKDELIKTRNVYNIDTVEHVISAIYTNIYDQLQAGNIDCLPIENPCQYCQYQSICLSSTSTNYKEELFAEQKLTEEVN